MVTQNMDLGAHHRWFSSREHVPHFCSQQGLQEAPRRAGAARDRPAVASGM